MRALRSSRPRIARACLALCLLGAAQARPARAEPMPSGARSTLFRKLATPDAQRAEALAAQAEQLIDQAERVLPADWLTLCSTTIGLPSTENALPTLRGKAQALYELSRDALRAQALIEGALARLERASALAPGDPALKHAHARALELVDQPGPPWSCRSSRRDPEAIELLQALRRDQPAYAPQRVTFELGVLLTRTERFEEAAAAYEQAAALAVDDGERSTALANLAETQMLAGEVEAAIASYEHALRLAHGTREHALAVFGLALALERNGEHDQAVERLQRAFGAAPEPYAVLRGPGVFFVPAREIHAYEAIAHVARARTMSARDAAGTEEGPEGIARELRAAASSYREYLAEASAARRRDEAREEHDADASDRESVAARSLAGYEATARENLERTLAELARLTKPSKRAKKPPKLSR